MRRHAKPRQTQVRTYMSAREFALLNAVRVYQECGDADMLGLVTRKFVDLLPPYGSDRKREPGRHARRWDA